MHSMFGDVIRSHRKKGSRSDMQCYERVRNLIQDLGSKMQTSGRRSDGPGLASKNGLVTRRVRFITRPTDIWRQGHGTTGINVDVFVELQDPLALCSNFLDLQAHIIDRRRRTNAHFSAWCNHAPPALGTETFQEQKFDPAVVRESPRRQYARVV